VTRKTKKSTLTPSDTSRLKPASGVLTSQQLRALVQKRVISAKPAIEERQYQPASLDLRLGETAYRMLSSFLPEQWAIAQRITLHDLLPELLMYEIDLQKGAVLEQGHVYLIPLMESLALPAEVRGRTNPKSTTGRLDVFTRTITDFQARFDDIRPGYRGRLFLEVVPRSFSVRVHAGMCLNQLRLFAGRPLVADAELRARHRADPLLYRDGKPLPISHLSLKEGLFLRVDLNGTESGIVGFRAKTISQILDMSRLAHYDPTDFWEPIRRPRNSTLLLEPEQFYILGSKERIRIPPDYAAEMVAYEAACGELRTHYAGFFDPGFGYGAGDVLGTPIVLEVRAHDVPFLIHDGQTFFKVFFERMQQRPEKVYGEKLGSSYQFQGLTLSKQFKPYHG
jgi:dCTP deaminase